MKDKRILLVRQAFEKVKRATKLIEHSVSRVEPFNPDKEYEPDELEPYDALSDRFIRSVELSIALMRSLEKAEFAETSDTLRDLLHRMEKLDLVSNATLWLNMRDVRNRIVHDYQPEQRKAMFDNIVGTFVNELTRFRDAAKSRLNSLEL